LTFEIGLVIGHWLWLGYTFTVCLINCKVTFKVAERSVNKIILRIKKIRTICLNFEKFQF